MTIFDFNGISSDHPLYVPSPKFGEAMDADGLSGCQAWLCHFTPAGTPVDPAEPPDPFLLTRGLRQGLILEAAPFDSNDGQGFFFTVPEREARFVTAAQFCAMRLLALPGRDCEWWFDRSTKKDLPDEEQRWYLRYSHHVGIWGLRIFANAQPEEVVVQRVKKQSENHLGHKDLRPCNLEIRPRKAVIREGKKMRRTYRGRDNAIEYVISQFGAGFKHLELDGSEYAALLAHAFAVLDCVHGHEITRRGRTDTF